MRGRSVWLLWWWQTRFRPSLPFLLIPLRLDERSPCPGRGVDAPELDGAGEPSSGVWEGGKERTGAERGSAAGGAAGAAGDSDRDEASDVVPDESRTTTGGDALDDGVGKVDCEFEVAGAENGVSGERRPRRAGRGRLGRTAADGSGFAGLRTILSELDPALAACETCERRQSREEGQRGRGLGERGHDARCWTCQIHRCASRKHPWKQRAARATAATATGATWPRPGPPMSLPAATSAWTGAIARQRACTGAQRARRPCSETHRGCGRRAGVVLRAEGRRARRVLARPAAVCVVGCGSDGDADALEGPGARRRAL